MGPGGETLALPSCSRTPPPGPLLLTQPGPLPPCGWPGSHHWTTHRIAIFAGQEHHNVLVHCGCPHACSHSHLSPHAPAWEDAGPNQLLEWSSPPPAQNPGSQGQGHSQMQGIGAQPWRDIQLKDKGLRTVFSRGPQHLVVLS